MNSPVQLLKPYQRAVYDDRARLVAWIAGRQVGKSFTAAARSVRLAMTAPKTDVLVASPSERQSYEAVLKCRDWAEAFDFAAEQILEERDGPGALMKAATICFRNGSRIIAVPGKPDTVRGFSAHVWMDEFAFFEDPDATWRAILPSISNPLRGRKTALITSTPNGRGGRGRRFWSIVTGGGTIDPAAPHHSLGTDEKYRANAWSVHRTPITHAAPALGLDVAELREAVDDEDAWRQEFLCEFIDGSSVLLPYDLIQKCESSEATLDGALPERGPVFGGIDFGRTSDPTVMWVLERVGDVLWTRAVKVLKDVNTEDQFEILRPLIGRCARVCIDYTGPGIGFGDKVAKAFHAEKTGLDALPRAKAELCTFSSPFKAAIFPRLRATFDARRIRVPIDVACREDLHEMQDIARDGRHTYTAKRTAEGHSDRCTALALAVRAADSAAVPPPPFSVGRRHNPDTRRID